jgi:hypothetical protein
VITGWATWPKVILLRLGVLPSWATLPARRLHPVLKPEMAAPESRSKSHPKRVPPVLASKT